MRNYRLPAVLGGGEIEAAETWGGCAGARPEYYLGDGFTLLAPEGKPLDLVKPPLPPEPPIGSVVLDCNGRAWQRVGPSFEKKDQPGGLWWCTQDIPDRSWAELLEDGPLVHLVPEAVES